MPSDVTPDLSLFDRFATASAQFASRAWFFAFCVLLVILWLPTYFLVGTVDTWQLIINTITTIVTFLLVALLQNTETRADEATQDKLNALAQGLSVLMTHIADIHDRGGLPALTELAGRRARRREAPGPGTARRRRRHLLTGYRVIGAATSDRPGFDQLAGARTPLVQRREGKRDGRHVSSAIAVTHGGSTTGSIMSVGICLSL